MKTYELNLIFVDVLALASSIGELTMHTRKARTTMWCALQMSGKDVPQLRMLSGSNGVPQPSLGTTITTSAAEAAAAIATASTSVSKAESSSDTNNNTAKLAT